MMTAPQTNAAASGCVEIDSVRINFTGKGRSTFEALSQTSFRLEPGSFTSLIGPSGCGKSTLLNAVAGFVPISSGAIRLDGIVVSVPTPDVGVVFQQYALFPWFSASRNVEFALKRFAHSRVERRRLALAALDEVGLRDRASTYPGQLSGGMKQRVALARTLAGRPKVLLMDEPFGALDAQTRMSMHELLLRIWEAHRTTVLFVTHDVDEALVLSDRVHVMSPAPGKIIDTIEIDSPRPRLVDHVDERYLARRNRIMRLLHQNQPKTG